MQFVKRPTAIAVLLLMTISVMGPMASGNEGPESMDGHTSSDGTSPSSQAGCQDRTVLAAVGDEIVSRQVQCLTDGDVQAASTAGTDATWLYGSTPSDACTLLWWIYNDTIHWYAADCFTLDRGDDPDSEAPCQVLGVSGKAGLDLCGLKLSSSSQAAACSIDPVDTKCWVDTVTGLIEDEPITEFIEGLCEGSHSAQSSGPDDCVDGIPDPGTPSIDACRSEPGVGVRVDGTGACIETAPENCEPPEVGVEPACLIIPDLIDPCEPHEVGVAPACVDPDPPTVYTCENEPGVGAKVDGTGTCIDPAPEPCEHPEVGVEPVCIPAGDPCENLCDQPLDLLRGLPFVGPCSGLPVAQGSTPGGSTYAFFLVPSTLGGVIDTIDAFDSESESSEDPLWNVYVSWTMEANTLSVGANNWAFGTAVRGDGHWDDNEANAWELNIGPCFLAGQVSTPSFSYAVQGGAFGYACTETVEVSVWAEASGEVTVGVAGPSGSASFTLGGSLTYSETCTFDSEVLIAAAGNA